MQMTLQLRRFMLTTHITFSVGWFGAVAAFLALAIAGVTSSDAQIVRAAYLMMELVGWCVIVPASIGALVTGILQSLGTQWGLFRHYWIVVKLVLTVGATLLLFLHMQPISTVAQVASEQFLNAGELSGLRIRLIADAGAAMLVLLINITVSVYKPWGKIRFESRRNRDIPEAEVVAGNPLKLYVLYGLIGFVILAFIIMHIVKGGFPHH
jgi:hypothetical protein